MGLTRHKIDRKAFKVTASIDWLEVALTTTRQTQFQHIQAELEKISGIKFWVKPLDKGEHDGTIATVFSIRFQSQLANSCGLIQDWFTTLSETYPFAGTPTIAAIEIACDFMHKTHSESDTLAMAHRLQTSLFAHGTKHRQFDPSIASNRFLDHFGCRINPDLNFRIGNKSDDISWHVYLKRTDTAPGEEKPSLLPQNQWRARVEFTLRGDAIKEYGFGALEDLPDFRFNKLACLLRFRRPVDPEKLAAGDKFKLTAIQVNRKIHDATPERGIHSFANIGRRDKYRNKLRIESRHLEPDHELQNAVRGALKRLNPMRKKMGQI